MHSEYLNVGDVTNEEESHQVGSRGSMLISINTIMIVIVYIKVIKV